MPISPKSGLRRICVLIDEQEHRQMRVVLAATGIPFSAWVRNQIRQVLEAREPKKKGKT